MCSGFFQPSYKRGKLSLQCVTICYSLSFKYPCNYFIRYSLLQFVTIRYNLLISN